jgi:hypothetical protein
MAIYYIGKTQRDIENISIFAGSETIFGMNENENYAMFSLTDEDKKKELSNKEQTLAYESLRFGMEKFNLFDTEATFVFSDKELMQKVLSVSAPDLKVLDSQTKLVENLNEFNK